MSETYTREEQYLSAIAEGTVPDLIPITRKEMFLHRIAKTVENIIPGSGGNVDQNAVRYTKQTLTEEQKSQARENIGVSWENLTDKPFGEEGNQTVIEWDGNTEGRDSVVLGSGTMVKVSDMTPDTTELTGAILRMSMNGEENEMPISDVQTGDGCYLAEGVVLVVQRTDITFGEYSAVAPSTGVYMMSAGAALSLTYGSSTIKTLDEKFIPNTIARVADIPTGGGAAIIDVIELPTENIREDCFYRLLSGSLVINQYVQNMFTTHCVETLPETGLPATNIDQTEGNIYYNLADGEAYGYIDDILSMWLSAPAGWYSAATLLGAFGYEYAGVITNILDDPIDHKCRLLLEYVVYDHKNGNWTSHKKIGWAGTGLSAEVFNHPSNTASGEVSHAEGYSSHAVGRGQHVQGEYNIIDPEYNADTPGARAKYAHIVGNGTSENNRSNAHTLDWNGLGWFAGGLKVGGTGQDDENAKEIATKDDVKDLIENFNPIETVEIFPTGSTGVWINNFGSFKTETANFYLHEPIRITKNMHTLHMKNVVVNTSVAKLVYSHTPTLVDGVSYPRVTLSGADGNFEFELDTSYEYLFISENTTTGGNIVEGARYFITQVAETNKPLEVHLAPRYDIVQGDTLELFYAGILNVPNPENYFIDISCDVGKAYRKRYMFTPGADNAGKNYNLTMTVRDDRGVEIGSAYTTIRVVSKNASQTSANVLCVGDSLTANGTWVNEFRNRLNADGFSNVKLIGSQTSGDVKHEGHAGWSYASYLASSAENPFWNASASALDFANYMTTLGLSGQTIDYCIILLGWNESNRSETEFIANVNRFCTALRTAYPNCKILFVGLQIPSQDGLGDNYGCAWNWRQKCNFVHNLDKWYQEVVSSLSNSTSVQLCGQFDTENNMPTGERQVNRRNPKTETYGTNGVHPNEYGYLQIADAVYRGFIGF